MATAAMIPLQTITLTGPDSSVTFASIPSDYRDLVVVLNVAVATGAYDLVVYLNNDTTNSNYSRVTMWGNGSSYNSLTGSETVTYYGAMDSNSNSPKIIQIFDANVTNKNKTYLTRASRANRGVDATASKWANNAAVTSVTLKPSSGQSFATGSILSLYGILGEI